MPFRRLKLRQLYKRIVVALLVGVTLLLLGGGSCDMADRFGDKAGCRVTFAACPADV